MEFLRVVATSLLSLVLLLIGTRMLGYRQISELTVFDYINSITVGSIAGELAAADSFSMAWHHGTALGIYVLFVFFLSIATCRSPRLRALISGKAILLYQNGNFFRDNMRKAKIDLHEFLTACRTQGYFDLAEVEMALLEINGAVSILPYAEYRPVTPKDEGRAVPSAAVGIPVIMDSHIMEENLRQSGYDSTWLQKELKRQKAGSASEVFLAIAMPDATLQIYPQKSQKR